MRWRGRLQRLDESELRLAAQVGIAVGALRGTMPELSPSDGRAVRTTPKGAREQPPKPCKLAHNRKPAALGKKYPSGSGLPKSLDQFGLLLR